MVDLPAWAAALRDDPAKAAELGLRALDESESAATRAHWLSIWNQIEFDEGFHGRAAARLERCVPVFAGPSRRRRLSKTESQLVVVFDPEDRDVLRLSLSYAIPSLAWADAGSSLESLRAALARYTVSDDPGALDFPKTERVVKQLELRDIGPIERSIDAQELWIDDARWGSAYLDDPWSGVSPDLGMLQLSTLVERVKDQHSGRRPSLSFRTLWSRSIFTIEQHPLGFWAFELRYVPAGDARAIRDLCGTDPVASLPRDLPVDLAASLMRGGSATRDTLRVNDEAGRDPMMLAVRCAMLPGEATTIGAMRDSVRAWADDPERGDALAQIADGFGHEATLFELAAITNDTRFAGAIKALLRPAAIEPVGDDGDDEEVAS
jgi:hypothetical protein